MKNRLTKISLIVLTTLFSVSASAQLKDGEYNAESKGVWGSPIKVNLSIKMARSLMLNLPTMKRQLSEDLH